MYRYEPLEKICPWSSISIDVYSVNWLCKDSFPSDEVTGACRAPLRATLRRQGHALPFCLALSLPGTEKLGTTGSEQGASTHWSPGPAVSCVPPKPVTAWRSQGRTAHSKVAGKPGKGKMGNKVTVKESQQNYK